MVGVVAGRGHSAILYLAGMYAYAFLPGGRTNEEKKQSELLLLFDSSLQEVILLLSYYMSRLLATPLTDLAHTHPVTDI